MTGMQIFFAFISNDIKVPSFSIENVLEKCGKWFLKICGNPVCCFVPVNLPESPIFLQPHSSTLINPYDT